ncbi:MULTISPECIES: type II toxin-antitoxin system Phd/YefM family antitoxin [unclassified Sphingopyxis]|uniref:type II toxin-antitoxin system Phd/YefM family antitoxin n=1 Tax=unclassified Sphingopyxis TaxID=2614943 RepID=UPI000DC6310A|nr:MULTISPECIES: type II toxin-antitoxin system prevent-host-death family antitoxin [unclassified Sphingopyxis]BBB07334.1 antitoxin of toxin-antitoxin stability system [Sphingopyxis sp. EG6]
MTIVTIHEAKTNLSRLIARVLAGEEVTIARGKEPVVKLMPVNAPPKTKRVLGTLKGKIDLDAGFWDPLPEEDLALWNGEDSPKAQ